LKSKREFRTFIKESLASFLSRKKALSQAGIMGGARVVGMAFGFIGSAWAARCLGPHNLGLSGMVQNMVSQAALLFGAINTTILIREYKNAKTDEARNELVRVNTSFQLAVSLLFCAAGAVAMGFRLVPFEYHFAGWFFLPLLLINALQPAWVFQAAEKQHFQSAISVLQSALKAGLYVCLFRADMSAGADLEVLTVVTLSLTLIYWLAIYRLTPMKGSLFDPKGFQMAWKLILQSRWLFISVLCSYVYTTLEQPLLGWLYSVDELGKYRTAVTAVGAADSLFTIIPIILFPRFFEWRKMGEEILWRRQLKLAALFTLLGTLATLSGFILIPFFYPLVFGTAFTSAAVPCAILVASRIIVIITGIFYWGLMTDDRHDRFLSLTTIGMATFSLFSNLVFIPKWGMYGAASVNLASEVILLAVCVWASVMKARKTK
jgi:O-antigen/teichoic acid export membrane protein